MAGRVNTKFVVALITVLIAVTVTPVGYWYFYVRVDPAARITRGDQFLAQGRTKKVIEQYGKALQKRPGDVDLMLKYVRVLKSAKTSDPRTARTYLVQVLGTLQQAITQAPRNPEPFKQLMEMYLALGRDLGDFESWKKMYEDADSRLRADPDSAQAAVAKKYRGIAVVNRMEKLDITEQQRQQAQQDLLDAREQLTDDRELDYYLAAWHILEGRFVARAVHGVEDEIKSLHEEALRISTESLRKDPNDLRRQLNHVRILGLVRRDDLEQETKSVLTKLEKQLLDDPASVRLVLEMVPLLSNIDSSERQPQGGNRLQSTKRAETLLRTALKAHPDEPRLMSALGRVLQVQRRNDEAMKLYKRAAELEPTTDPFVGVQLDQLRAGAMVRYAELLLRKTGSNAPADREAVIQEAEELIDRVVSNHGESGETDMILGKIALARRQWGEASVKLDRANAQFEGTRPEALLLAARAWVQMGEVGAATDRLEKLIQLRPGYIPARYELVRLYIGLNRLDDAQSHLEVIAQSLPNAPYVLLYKAQVLAKRGQAEQAIDILSSPSPELKKIPELIPTLASLYTAAGQPDIARQILEDRFEENPSDIRSLQELIRVSQDTEQARAYIQAARKAGADANALEILESQFEGRSSLVQVLEELIETETDPFNRYLKRYHLYRRLGEKEKAIQELNQAAKLKPNDPMVLSTRFDQALLERDWDTAQTLVGRAEALNIDMAHGAFFAGRLHAAKGELGDAVVSFRRGLSLRKVYSEGWRRLADVQRLMSDLSASESSYRQALSQRPNNTAALRGLAMVQSAAGRHSQAIENLRKAMGFAPQNRALREEYLQYEQRFGQAGRALKLRKKLASADPRDVVNRRGLAMLLVQSDQAAEAQRVVDNLIKDVGLNRFTAGTAAAVRRLAGDTDGALQLLRDYVNGLNDKATDEDWLLLARFYLDAGQDDMAMAAFRQAINAEDPKQRRATREYADLLFKRGQYVQAAQRYQQLWGSSPEDKRVGYRYVETLLLSNEPDRARQILGEVVGQHGREGETFVLEAMIARNLGHTGDALTALNRAIELDPRRAVAYYQRADLQAADPNNDAAVIDDLNHALKLDPGMSATRRMLATIHVRRGERSDAIRELVKLLELDPRHVAARLQLVSLYQEAEQWTQRRALLEESARLFPKAAIWLQLQAQQALINKDATLALQKLEEAFTLTPNPQTLGELASLLIQTGKAPQAVTLLRNHGEMVRDVPLLHALRGKALVKVGDEDMAMRSFSRAIEQCESFTEVAAVATQMRQAMTSERAISELELLAASDEVETGLVELGIAQLESEAGQLESARARLKRIDILLEGSPDRGHFDRLMALVLHQQGEHEKAMEVYERLLQQQPNNVITLNNAAYVLTEGLGRAHDAIPLARRAADLAPNNSLVLDTLGWSLFKAGQIESALDALKRSVRLGPTPVSYMHLADVLQKLGDYSEATQMLNQAISLAKKSNDQQNQWLASRKLDELTRTVEPR